MVKDPKKNKLPPIRFELEEDADELFRQAIDNMGDHIDKHETKEPAKLPPKKSGRKKSEQFSIDLHGLTLKEAEQRVDRLIAEILFELRGEASLKVITGKGRHSGPDGAVLPGGIWTHVKRRWSRHIASIEDSPEEVKVAGLPIRGHFNVVLKP